MYYNRKKTSPVVTEVNFRVVLAILLTFRILGGILDVKSAFSHGEFENDEANNLEVPEGF